MARFRRDRGGAGLSGATTGGDTSGAAAGDGDAGGGDAGGGDTRGGGVWAGAGLPGSRGVLSATAAGRGSISIVATAPASTRTLSDRLR
jgi:hypothetical protein